MKTILLLSMLWICGCSVLGQDTTTITTLQQETYVYQFRDLSYEEPTSALPLALLIVFGFLLILVVLAYLHDFYLYLIAKNKK